MARTTLENSTDKNKINTSKNKNNKDMRGPFDTDSFRLGRLLNRISGSLSILGSLYIIQNVLRDSKKRQKVANQVVVALSFADLNSSFFGSILGQWPAPKGTVQGAIGNVGTCATVAFISQNFFVLSTYLNASLAITYLLMIKYGWKEERLHRNKLYLFCIPIFLTLPFTITSTALGGGNFFATFCSNLATDPFWCGAEDPSTCIRGEKLAQLPLFRLISATIQTVLSLPIIVGCMILLYLAVLNIEKKNDKYRFDGGLNRKQSKRIAIQGIYYVWAFLIVEAIWCAIIIVGIITNRSGDPYQKLNSSASFFVPLQGFFNALVYLRPSYLEYLRENPEKTIPNRIRRLFGIKVNIPVAEGSSSSKSNKNTNSDDKNDKIISKNSDNYAYSAKDGAAHGLCSGDDSQISNNNNNSHHYFSNTTTISSSRTAAGEDTNQDSIPSRNSKRMPASEMATGALAAASPPPSPLQEEVESPKTTSAAMSMNSSTLPKSPPPPPPCATNNSQQALAVQEEHEQNHASPQIQAATTMTTTSRDSKMKSSLTSPVSSPFSATVARKTTNFTGRVTNIESDDGLDGDDDYDEKL